MEKHFTIGALIAGSGVIALRIKAIIAWAKNAIKWMASEWTKVSPIVIPIVMATELMFLQGKVTKEGRKKWAMDLIAFLKQKGLIKLNFFQDFALSKAVDYAAEHLPDMDISAELKQAIDEFQQLQNELKTKEVVK